MHRDMEEGESDVLWKLNIVFKTKQYGMINRDQLMEDLEYQLKILFASHALKTLLGFGNLTC